MVDINEPVKRGQDMILNYDGQESTLGSADGFDREAAKGKLISLPPNDNPNGDVNPGDQYDALGKKAQSRDKKGHFAKK